MRGNVVELLSWFLIYADSSLALGAVCRKYHVSSAEERFIPFVLSSLVYNMRHGLQAWCRSMYDTSRTYELLSIFPVMSYVQIRICVTHLRSHLTSRQTPFSITTPHRITLPLHHLPLPPSRHYLCPPYPLPHNLHQSLSQLSTPKIQRDMKHPTTLPHHHKLMLPIHHIPSQRSNAHNFPFEF
jgi:hypothetical protein